MNQQRRVHTEQDNSHFGNPNQYTHQAHPDQYDINQLPDNEEDQYDIQNQAAQAAAADDDENIDFNNYKGIYAEDDAGQKYQCPETGAHFEPSDLCKRIYRIVEKRKPFEMELYGQSMLVDGVGSSLIAKAPYANDKPSNIENIQRQKSNPKQNIPANARAGSMNQPVGV